MRTIYDETTDSLFVRLAEGKIAESEEVRPGLVVDYDAAGRIVAFEVLDASRTLAEGADLPKSGDTAREVA